MQSEILVRLGLKQARQAARSMEFLRRNIERIAVHLPKDRRAKEIYKQLIYDSSLIFGTLHDELEMASINCTSLAVV